MIAATGRALSEGKARLQNSFKLFIEQPETEAQVCLHLDVSMEGPGRAQVTTNNFGNGTIGVSYRVPQSGAYVLRITLQGLDVAGSPFHVKVR